jgi:membrane protease YdiL (CAAX protease family)
MSDTAIALTYGALKSGPAVATTAPGKRLGLAATFIWGAAGIAALMIFWLSAQLPQALHWLSLSSYPVLVLVSFGHIAAVAVVAAALWSHRLPFRDTLALLALRGRDVGSGIVYGLLALLVLCVVNALIPLVQSALGGGVAALPFTPPQIGGTAFTLVTLWIGMVIAAPIAEELLFRGLLYRGLVDTRLGAFGAVLVTSLAFGIVHAPGFGWPRMVSTACVGLLLGWLRWQTGNTVIGIVAHAVMNLMGALLLTAFVLVS